MSRRGFTLIEMLVVIGIITLLASMVVVFVHKMTVTAKIAATEGFLDTLVAGCEAYKGEQGVYPAMEPCHGSQNLHYYLGRFREVTRNGYTKRENPIIPNFRVANLLGNPAGPYPDPPVFLVDAFGNIIEYRRTGTTIEIISKGMDGQLGTDDDLVRRLRQ